jgi:hypothetical protein
MYLRVSSNDIYQGDIIIDFHFIVAPIGEPISLQLKRSILTKVPISSVANRYKTGNETLLVNSFIANGMIITQTCDVQRRKYIAISPIHNFNTIAVELTNEGLEQERIKNFVEQIKQQKINYYFYLPPITLEDGSKIEEAYVDLQVINSIPRENVSKYKRLTTLSDKGRHWLDYKLMNLFGRPFE